MDEIDERIRLKAGNVLPENKPARTGNEPPMEKQSSPAELPPQKPAEPKFGTGISEAEIDRIMKDFKP